MELPKGLHIETHSGSHSSRSNWLRAAVLGANDGMISLAALVVGVAGATDTLTHIVATGVAGLLAGSLSMAVGEYVSVSSQRDTELALLEKERKELEMYPVQELEELTGIYEQKGLKRTTAELVANELTEKDAYAAHVEAELKIDPEDLTNPWHAAFASAASFVAGAVVPLASISLPPAQYRIPATFVAVFFALVATGALSARVSGARVPIVAFRVVSGGILAMLITFGIGWIFGVAAA